ncbi:DUF5996 family protein [Methylocapsa polymorpha]|uniref:DUF5996 family protein n=1 Tax=Methylocapsa polymorpha TaxID=3080828 RepID=A0ABZ0HUU9_9HYPH|nr:DUF5996 family protein [Methylocapsa sp. RX1]
MTESADAWPSLAFEEWRETRATLHLWTQVVGKIRLAQAPMINHWWQTPFYVTARGLTTSPIPYGSRTFQIDFDFIDHRLVVASSDGGVAGLALAPRSVASFYGELMEQLKALDIDVKIWTTPVEIPDAIPFEKDHSHASYDKEFANRFWRILVQCDRVFKLFRSRFIGKVSPVHFFWGSFDLAVTRFSGRRAPDFVGAAPNVGNWVMREAYSHEVSSCGFWPGDDRFPTPTFYSYAYPPPPGFSLAAVRPSGAYWDGSLAEFVLPYDAVRRESAVDERLLEFLESTYVAAADLGHWDRAALERDWAV